MFGSRQSPANGRVGCAEASAGRGTDLGTPRAPQKRLQPRTLLEGLGRGRGADGGKKNQQMQRVVKAGGLSPSQGTLAMGGETFFPARPLAPASPFHTPVMPARRVQAVNPLLPLAAAGLEAGFAISLSIDVSVGYSNQNNSLKRLWPVLLRLSTKAPFRQVLPTHYLPVCLSVCPASLPVEGVSSSKEPKLRRPSPKGSSSPQLSFSPGLTTTSAS